MGKQAFNTIGMIKTEAIFSTQYRNDAYAVAETVDNAIDAGAKNIYIYLHVKILDDNSQLFELFVINDGKPIPHNGISDTLVHGNHIGEDMDSIGKFGVGFKQALFSMCKRIDVYSFDDLSAERGYRAFFDTDFMLDNNIEEILDDEPFQKHNEFRSNKVIEILNKLESDNTTSCVIVKASNFDDRKINPKDLLNELKTNLGRIYRYLITSTNNEPIVAESKKVNIYIVTDEDRNYTKIKPEDPLFLMKDDKHLINPNNIEQTFSIGTQLVSAFETKKIEGINLGKWEMDSSGNFYLEVIHDYYDGNNKKKQSKLFVKTSIAKKIIGNSKKDPGNFEIGRIAKDRNLISFIREGREIDFDSFRLYNLQSQRTQDRWWNIEVHFSSDFDKKLGVTNNKQTINLTNNFKLGHRDTAFREFMKDIYTLIKREYNKIWDEYRKGSRKPPKPEPAPPTGEGGQNNPPKPTPEPSPPIGGTGGNSNPPKPPVECPNNPPVNEGDKDKEFLENMRLSINEYNKNFHVEKIYRYQDINIRKGKDFVKGYLIFCKSKWYKGSYSFEIRQIDEFYNVANGLVIGDAVDLLRESLEMYQAE